jgi:hypothetical protein
VSFDEFIDVGVTADAISYLYRSDISSKIHETKAQVNNIFPQLLAA